MGIIENLVQGFATAAGADESVKAIQNKKDDRRATQHEELQANTKAILDDVKRLQDRRAALPPNSPEIATIDKSLHDHMQAFQDLYHPTKNPGALSKLGGFLKEHLGGQAPKPAPQSNAVTTDRMTQLQSGAAGTIPPDPYLTPDELLHKARIAAGIEPRAKETPDKFQSQLTETTDEQGKKHYWRVPQEAGGKPEEVDFQGQKVTPKTGAGGNSKFAQEKTVYERKWGKPIAEWTPEQLTYFNQKMAYDSKTAGESTTTRIEKDQNGVLTPVTVTNEHGPGRPPVEPGTTPQTSGSLRHKAAGAAPQNSNVKVGAPLPFKGATSTVTAAQKDVVAAVKLSSVADQVAKQPNDAVNQKRLAVALERQAAGRFTTQALDYIRKAGWSAGAEQFWNNIDNGTLPETVIRQLVDGAHQNEVAARAALKEAEGMGGDSDIDEIVKGLKNATPQKP